MATFPEELRTFITGSTTVSQHIGNRMHYNRIPTSSVMPYGWFQTASDSQPLTLDAAASVHEARYDMELVAGDEDTAQTVADAVKELLHGHRGAVNTATAQGIFVEDKDDSYEPRSAASEQGRSIVALDVRAWYTT